MQNESQLIVVETSPYLQVILDAALGEYSNVTHVSQCEQCLAELDSMSILFVDLLLEDIDGLSLIEKVRLKNRDLPIVAFVPHTEIAQLNIEEAATRSMAEQSGADVVFFAPFNLGEILHTTTRLLAPVASPITANKVAATA